MKSMTGYGEASSQIRGTRVTVQVRSLNHRHLDLQLRAPREYLSFEEEIRKVIRQKISRGRLDVFINRSPAKRQGRRLELDEELLGEYLTTVRQAKQKYQLSGDFNVSLLYSIPDLPYFTVFQTCCRFGKSRSMRLRSGKEFSKSSITP
jgi:uncharacterized protein (TIGR00255 family)